MNPAPKMATWSLGGPLTDMFSEGVTTVRVPDHKAHIEHLRRTILTLVGAGDLLLIGRGRHEWRVATREALALIQVDPPNESDDVPRMVSRFGLQSGTPTTRTRGVYFLGLQGRVMYIGVSTDIRRRVREHGTLGKHFDSVHYLPMDSRELFGIEIMFMCLLRPPMNRLPPTDPERIQRLARKHLTLDERIIVGETLNRCYLNPDDVSNNVPVDFADTRPGSECR
jgi:hypothetical protein